jgi:hypothetical protein
MPRVLIHVEGETEETFVWQVLGPKLYELGYHKVAARLVGNARQRDRRGGVKPWPAVSTDILRHLKEDTGCLATTMIDYYGLPASGPGAWPGRADASTRQFSDKGATVQQAMLADVSRKMGSGFDTSRFIPFVMMHEFEGLLFSDCHAFAKGIGRPELAKKLQDVRSGFNSPEEINDSPFTAPSKRVVKIVPGYQKPLFGSLGARSIGIDKICAECPHFRSWVGSLEAWARQHR